MCWGYSEVYLRYEVNYRWITDRERGRYFR